ncbi:MAG: N-acetylneuraminate synthase [Elusimicrobia bacterium]|nr:N-acetylneuraminate synthase [Elusimicrobiota bacterium]
MVRELGVFIIAEAGVNHDGSLEQAHRLVDAAVESGADAVKFQTFTAELLANGAAPRAPYQQREVGAGSQVEMLRRLELEDKAFVELAAHCSRAGIEFMSTPFHKEAADLLEPLVRRFKIGSGDLTDIPLLEHVARKGKPLILSTGMSGNDEIERALKAVAGSGVPVSLLHCTSLYPAPFDTVNLKAMAGLRARFGVPVGYSDHTLGLAVPAAAAALGAAIVEKHFTLSRALKGPDHAASLEPAELRTMVEMIRQVEVALGDGVKRVMPGEEATRAAARKSLVARRDLPAGTTLGPDMVAAKRPGTGIPPADLAKVLGRTLRRDVKADEPLGWDFL